MTARPPRGPRPCLGRVGRVNAGRAGHGAGDRGAARQDAGRGGLTVR